MSRKLSFLLLITVLISSLSLSAMAAPEDTEMDAETVTETETETDDTPSALEEYTMSYQSTTVVDYSGALDPLTGLPADSAANDSPYVELKDGSYGYDKDQRCFVNEVSSSSFNSNIPNGAILSAGRQTVSFTVPSGLVAELYCNGELLPDADLTNIVDEGAYILNVSPSNSYDSTSFNFRLLGEMTNDISEFSLPAGFVFESVMLNGENLTSDYVNYAQIIEDGSYEIVWSNTEIGQRYTTAFKRDTTPPVLELPEVVDGEAHSEVTLTDLEANAYIELTETSSGEIQTIKTSTTKIKEAGTYHLTVYDEAGNHSDYDFTIHFYLNISAVAAIALLAAGVIALCMYSRYIKKHPRVG